MNDDISSKVINIFQRHRQGDNLHFEVEEGGELVISPDGFNYVSLKQDCNGNNDEKAQLEMAASRRYIIKMMEVHAGGVLRLNNYDVPGERLEEFLTSLAQRPGKILEIKQFLPDHMA